MALSPETLLGPYQIRSLLGSGGMGEVYLAHDMRLGRDVAVKVLPESASGDPERLKRFEQEARAAAALNHPGILAIHDVGWHDGSRYIVSELLEGETLRERLRAGPLPVRKALETALALARALAAAHEKGIVHRDLKPENVFLTRDGQVKVLDFGLARLLPRAGPESERDAKSTVTGTVLGTPSYMSPEQLRGQKTDACADVFSFGVLLFEMLAGRRPFLGESAADVEAAILQQDPSRLQDLDVAVSPLVERIVERCLEKQPEERFASARELAITLEAVSGSEGVAALPSPTLRRLRRLARRRLHWAALILLFVIAAGWAVWRSRQSGAEARIQSLAVLPLLNLSGDPGQEHLADGVTEALISNLARIQALKVISRTSVTQYKTSKKPLPAIARELNVDAVVEGSVLRSGNRVRVTAQLIRAATDEHLWTQTYDRDLTDILALQSDVVQAIAGEVRSKLTSQEAAALAKARRVDPEAYSLYLKGRYRLNAISSSTGEDISKAITDFENATKRDPGFALAWAGLAEAHATNAASLVSRPQEEYAKAEMFSEKALLLDPDLPEALAVLGWIRCAYDWDFAGADKTLLRAVQLGPSSYPAHYWRSFYLTVVGRFDEAIAEGQRLVELNPGTFHSHGWLSFILSYARRYDEAIAILEKARASYPTVNLDYDYMICTTHAAAGRSAQALEACDRAMARAEIGQNMVIDGGVGWAYAVSGRPSEAIRILETRKRFGPEVYVDSYAMAEIYAGLGDRERALEALEKGYKERSTYMIGLKIEYMFDNLRSDPRYEQLMRKVGLPVS